MNEQRVAGNAHTCAWRQPPPPLLLLRIEETDARLPTEVQSVFGHRSKRGAQKVEENRTPPETRRTARQSSMNEYGFDLVNLVFRESHACRVAVFHALSKTVRTPIARKFPK